MKNIEIRQNKTLFDFTVRLTWTLFIYFMSYLKDTAPLNLPQITSALSCPQLINPWNNFWWWGFSLKTIVTEYYWLLKLKASKSSSWFTSDGLLRRIFHFSPFSPLGLIFFTQKTGGILIFLSFSVLIFWLSNISLFAEAVRSQTMTFYPKNL